MDRYLTLHPVRAEWESITDGSLDDVLGLGTHAPVAIIISDAKEPRAPSHAEGKVDDGGPVLGMSSEFKAVHAGMMAGYLDTMHEGSLGDPTCLSPEMGRGETQPSGGFKACNSRWGCNQHGQAGVESQGLFMTK